MTGSFFLDAFLLLLIATIVALWWTGMRAKELATRHARLLCQRESVQFLDYTVALKKLRLSRTKMGSTCLRREFSFEFTAEGQHRDHGTVLLNGHTLVKALLPYTRDEEGNRVFLN